MNAPSNPRTGARPTAASRRKARRGVERVVYRGVRWRRDETSVGWYNDGIERWVRWRPDADAPPPPPRWLKDGMPAPPPRVARARWRSPYRLVPLVLVIGVVIIGIIQATHQSSNPVASEKATAEKLLGKCLSQRGTAKGHPAYGASPVPCNLQSAAVKVVKVIPGTPGSPRCPIDTTNVQLAYPGVRYPHVECVQPVNKA